MQVKNFSLTKSVDEIRNAIFTQTVEELKNFFKTLEVYDFISRQYFGLKRESDCVRLFVNITKMSNVRPAGKIFP